MMDVKISDLRCISCHLPLNSGIEIVFFLLQRQGSGSGSGGRHFNADIFNES